MGTMYQGLRFLTLFAMVLKEVDFWPFSPMVLKEVLFLDPLLDGLERTLLPEFW